MSKYFKPSEFRACTPSCKETDMDQDFLLLLDRIRESAGIPMVLNSAYRSREYELKHNRSGNSAHTRGMAVDVRCNTSANRFRIIRAAIGWGVRRIGIAETYIHLDNDPTLPQDVLWHYYE